MRSVITRTRIALIASILATSAAASAMAAESLAPAEFTAAELVAATQNAVKLFSETNPDHAVHLTGFKTWKSGADAKVKIYVNHNGMAMEHNFQCAQSTGGIRCVAI
jgi:hypothetical protein